MFKKGLIAVVTTKEGEVFREHDNEIRMRFGTEYGLRFKNTNDKRAVVYVKIDGNDVLDGTSLVIDPDSTVDLLGFIDTKKNKITNRFKFIEKTDFIREYRSDKIEDGIIEIKFSFEVSSKETDIHHHHHHHYYYNPSYWWNSFYYNPNGYELYNTLNTNSVAKFSSTCDTSDGITVKGSSVDVNLGNVIINTCNDVYSMTFVLKGYRDDKSKVKINVTTREKIACNMCGIKNNSKHKFCYNCGNSLDC